MLCTGLCTTCALRTAGCGQRCGKPVAEKRYAKPIAAQRIGPLEISHALRSEGRNEETRDGRETGAQVNRITDDRLDRVRSDEVLEAFGLTGPRATPRRNAGPVDQIASPWVHRSAGAARAPPSQWPPHPVRRESWAIDRSSIVGRLAGPRSCTTPWERAVTPVTAAPTPVGTRRHSGDSSTHTSWPTTDPLRWRNRHHTWEARTLRRLGPPLRTRLHLGGARPRTRRSTQQLVLPAAGRTSTREPLELILRGALTLWPGRSP